MHEVVSHAGDSGWYQGTQVQPYGDISARGVDRDVTTTDVGDDAVNSRIDAAYRTKHRHYGAADFE
ncbi:DUF2255 family protein [Streptomyces sp. bgisy027]|uniref:DUF2255 family protein n=1 Tax=unclassified Streptomyces TaxID=2593676 RepID=UPI003D72768E